MQPSGFCILQMCLMSQTIFSSQQRHLAYITEEGQSVVVITFKVHY